MAELIEPNPTEPDTTAEPDRFVPSTADALPNDGPAEPMREAPAQADRSRSHSTLTAIDPIARATNHVREPSPVNISPSAAPTSAPPLSLTYDLAPSQITPEVGSGIPVEPSLADATIAPVDQPSTGGSPTPATAAPGVYEWEIFIEAPFPVDLLKLLWSLLKLPAQLIRKSGDAARTNRFSFALRVLTYNLGLLGLIGVIVPLVFFMFSYLATLPFLLMRGLSSRIGFPAMSAIAVVMFLAMLALPIHLYHLLFRPEAWRDHYKKSKVEILNLLISASFFLAGGALEYIIASPVLPLHRDFTGPVESTQDWTLFFADKSVNLLFANLPNKFLGPLSNIRGAHEGDGVPVGMLRILLIFGYVTLVRLLAIKLLFSKRELFYGTEFELRRYLDLCGKAEAHPLRGVIELPETAQSRLIRSKLAPNRPLVGAPARPDNTPRAAEEA